MAIFETPQEFNPNVDDLRTRQALQRIQLAIKQLRPLVFNGAPTTADDASKGYLQGKTWIDETGKIVYRLNDNTPGAAVWQQMIGTNATAGSGGVAGAGALDGTVDYLGVFNVASSLNKRVTINELVTAGAAAIISDTAYAGSWDAVTAIAPSKNAVYDKIQTLQPLDATLTALAAFNTNGLLTQTAADTFVGRTLTGTTNKITVSNGDGVSGNPTVTIPDGVVLVGPVLGTPASGTLTNCTGLPVAGGGTGVSSIAALSIWLANSANVITSVTPGAGNSIRINAGGTAWEAYTPGGGHTIKEEGSALTARANLNFIGTIVTAADNAGTNATDVTITIPSAHVTSAMLRDSAALSVIGRSLNSVGVPADITAVASGQVLRVSGTTLGFGAVDLANPDAVSGLLAPANLAAMTSDELAAIVSNETGTGLLVFATGPTMTLTNATGLSLTTGVTGTLPVANGGTGVVTLADGGLMIGNVTGAVEVVAAGLTTQILVGGGALTAPVWTTATGTGAPVRATSPTLVTPLLGTPTSGVLTNCTGLPAANIVSGTLAAKLNLGEGADPATLGIALDESLSADERYSGIVVAGTAGATLAFGDLCYLDVTAAEWLLADADAASTSGSVVLGICVDASTDGAATSMLLLGTVRSAAFPASIALGAPVYVSTTAGDITATQPSGVDDVIRVVGFAITVEPNTLYFNPSMDYITHV